jgi:hypothetical protein
MKLGHDRIEAYRTGLRLVLDVLRLPRHTSEYHVL